jgi:hypothetical protein
MLQEMEKDLFAIFPDLPGPRPTRRVQRRRPPKTGVARRRIPVRRDTRALWTAHIDAALRRIRQIAQTQYERLPSRQKTSGVGLALQQIVGVADAAMRAE